MSESERHYLEELRWVRSQLGLATAQAETLARKLDEIWTYLANAEKRAEVQLEFDQLF